MTEKGGAPVGIDDTWPAAASSHLETITLVPAAASAPQVGPDHPLSAASGPTSALHLPTPPAQLLAALADFETDAPDSFRNGTAAAPALQTTTVHAEGTTSLDKQTPLAEVGSNEIPALTASAKLRIALIVAGVLVVLGVIWALSSSKSSSRREPSSAIPSSAGQHPRGRSAASRSSANSSWSCRTALSLCSSMRFCLSRQHGPRSWFLDVGRCARQARRRPRRAEANGAESPTDPPPPSRRRNRLRRSRRLRSDRSSWSGRAVALTTTDLHASCHVAPPS
jgi:hypothetical protein